MVLNNNAIVSITVEQELLGEDVVNVFYYLYQLTVAGVALVDVLLDFRTLVWTFVRGSQNPDHELVNLVARDLSNGIDIDNLAGVQIGLDVGGGPVMPSYVAAGYALNVGSLETRPGSKRFAGISEDRVTNNAYDASGTVSDDIEDKLALTIPIVGVPSGAGFIIPQIVGRDAFGVIDLARVQPITSAAVATSIRSQVSRRS